MITTHRLRTALFAGTATVALAALANTAMAQQTPETVVVTGSRIAVQPGLQSSTPVLAVSSEDLAKTGMDNIADLATQLPQFAASFGASRTQSTFSGTATSGLNLVNLRNLGTFRSLVLINGRRAMAGTTFDTSVDFNTIPTANIDRMEVITGGASAVYGADAVAGVVNIITKKDMEGLEAGFSYGLTTGHGDNINPSFYAVLGTSLGSKGHFTLTGQYSYEGLVRCRDRYLCAQDFNWSPPSDPVRGPGAYSGVPPQGRFFIQDDINNPGHPGSGSWTSTDGGSTYHKFATAKDGYNRNPNRTLAIPTKRILFAADGDYEVAKNVHAFMEFNYGSSRTDAPFEATPFQSTANLVGGAVEASIPYDNPFIPTVLKSKMTPGSDLSWFERLSGIQQRGAVNLRQTIRVVAGVNGDLDTLFGFGHDFHWEASYVYGRTSLDGSEKGDIDLAHLYAGLRVTPDGSGGYQCSDPVAQGQGCVPINPFAPYTDQEKAWLTANNGLRGGSELEDGVIYISGAIFDLPAGPVNLVLGGEWYRFSGFDDYSDAINQGTSSGNQISDDGGQGKRQEFFTELSIPILKDQFLARSLAVEGAYRLSHADGIGTYDTWKYGLTWSPINDLRFRVMRNYAVRTPAPGEVSGISQDFGTVNDPCTAARFNANPTRAANCLADGVPHSYAPLLITEQSVSGFVGGNPKLKPETATTLTYGLVYTPEWIPNLSMTVDAFDINLKGVISTVGRQNLANLCYDTAGPGRAVFCGQLQRGYAVAEGVNYVLLKVNDQNLNIATLHVGGVDAQLNYGFDVADVVGTQDDYGQIAINSVWTFYTRADQIPLPGQPAQHLLGFAGGSTSDQGWINVTSDTTFNYALGDFGGSWTVRFIGATGQSPFVTDYPKIGARFYHDMRVYWNATKEVELYVGLNNVFDSNPPFFGIGASGTQALDTVPAYYDVIGRFFYGGVKFKM